MDMATRMKTEIQRRKAAQAAAGLSVLITGELRHLPGRFAGALRGARLSDVGAVRGKAVGYAGRAGAVAARTYEHLAARGRDAMASKGR
jgi:hypothetical protein